LAYALLIKYRKFNQQTDLKTQLPAISERGQ